MPPDATMATIMMAFTPTMEHTLFILRIVSPALVVLSTLSIIPARAPPALSPSSITSVVVKTSTPRRALILSFLSLASLSFLADGLTFVIYAVLNKYWPKYTAIEINAILGIIAYSGLAALGAYKDIKGVDVWSFRSIKTAVTLALIFDIAQVILLGLSLEHGKLQSAYALFKRSSQLLIIVSISVLLHLAFPAFRVLLLVPLTFALYNPRVSYLPIQPTEDVVAPVPTDSSFLIAPEHTQASTGLSPISGKYGTFRSARSSIPASGPTTRAATPVITTGTLSSSKTSKKEDVSYNPSWKEFGQRLRRLTPYLWPSGSRPLQFIAVRDYDVLIIR
jgi:hypothetical protein